VGGASYIVFLSSIFGVTRLHEYCGMVFALTDFRSMME